MNFKGWWYDYKIKMGLLSHVDRFMPHAEAAWNAAQAQRAEGVPQRYDVYGVKGYYEDESPETESMPSSKGKWVLWTDIASQYMNSQP